MGTRVCPRCGSIIETDGTCDEDCRFYDEVIEGNIIDRKFMVNNAN